MRNYTILGISTESSSSDFDMRGEFYKDSIEKIPSETKLVKAELM